MSNALPVVIVFFLKLVWVCAIINHIPVILLVFVSHFTLATSVVFSLIEILLVKKSVCLVNFVNPQ